MVGGDWNMTCIFPYIQNNHPSWLIFFGGVETTNQIGMCHELCWKRWRRPLILTGDSWIDQHIRALIITFSTQLLWQVQWLGDLKTEKLQDEAKCTKDTRKMHLNHYLSSISACGLADLGENPTREVPVTVAFTAEDRWRLEHLSPAWRQFQPRTTIPSGIVRWQRLSEE